MQNITDLGLLFMHGDISAILVILYSLECLCEGFVGCKIEDCLCSRQPCHKATSTVEACR